MTRNQKALWWGGVVLTSVAINAVGRDWTPGTGLASFLTNVRWLELLSAVGTLGATFAAVYFGLTQREEARREKLELAQLVSSEISVRLSQATQRAGDLDAIWGFENLDRNEPDLDRVEQLRSLSQLIGDPILSFKRETLIALAPLPNHAAHRIARAQDYFKLCRDQLRRFEKIGIPDRGARLAKLHDICGQYLSSARMELVLATAECVKAAHLAVPITAAEVLFGGPDEE